MSEWRITPEYVEGHKTFSIYRKLDQGYIDNEQNREYLKRFMSLDDANDLLLALEGKL